VVLVQDTAYLESGVATDLGDFAAEAAKPVERRRGLRVRQHRPVKVYEATCARYFGGQTEDVSATGLRLELPLFAPVRAGDTLNLHIGLNEQGQGLANRRQMLPARVVWVRRDAGSAKSGRLVAGVEFLANIAAHLHAA
jgi:hypothetical protein